MLPSPKLVKSEIHIFLGGGGGVIAGGGRGGHLPHPAAMLGGPSRPSHLVRQVGDFHRNIKIMNKKKWHGIHHTCRCY